jgi:hypothetical protein
MGTLLGSSVSVSTWGKFRCTLDVLTDYDQHYTETDYSIEYTQGFKSASSGSGLIRYESRFIEFPHPAIYNQIYLINYGPPLNEGNYMGTYPARYLSPSYESIAVTNEVQTELTGQTVTFSGGYTATISGGLWTSNRQNWRSNIGASGAPYVNGVGKLVAFYS